MIAEYWRGPKSAFPKTFRKFLGIRSLATFDVVLAFPAFSPSLVQILFGVLCTFSGVGLRWIVDHFWAGAGPFGLMVPFVLLATLFGRWQAGLLTAVLSSLHAWYFILPINESWSFEVATDKPRVFVNIAAALFVVALAELFRRTMWQALNDRDMLLREIEHRVKNNFASVASLLRLQMRENPEDTTIKNALQSALRRIDSYAIVNTFLYRGVQYTGTVDMSAYLAELCANLEKSVSLEKPVRIITDVQAIAWDRDRAIVVGLLINELVANALKHAFPGKRSGLVKVRMQTTDQDWSLEVSDNGTGFVPNVDVDSLGSKLLSALATQISATFKLSSGNNGTQYRFTGSRDG